MSDRRFDDIVIESTSMIGPEGKYHTAVCKTCSSQHKVTSDEFERTDLYTLVSTEDGLDTKPTNELERRDNADEILAYVAEMRAWNCCHENEEPLDGFPETPDSKYIDFE
jgi:hypothetical protein